MIFMLIGLIGLVSASATVCTQYGNHYYCTSIPTQAEIYTLDNDLGIEITNFTFYGNNSTSSALAGEGLNRTFDWDNYVKITGGINLTSGNGYNGHFAHPCTGACSGSDGGDIFINITAPSIEISGEVYAKGGYGANGSCSGASSTCDGMGGYGGDIILIFNSTNSSIITNLTKINLTGGNSGNGDADAICETGWTESADGMGRKGGSVTATFPSVIFGTTTITGNAGNGGSSDIDVCSSSAGDSEEAESGYSDGDISMTFGNLTLNNTNITFNYGTNGVGDCYATKGDDDGASESDSGKDAGTKTLRTRNAFFNASRINIYTQKGSNAVACAVGDEEAEASGGYGGNIRMYYDTLESNDSLINLVTGTGGNPAYTDHEYDGGNTGTIWMIGNLILDGNQNVTLSTMASSAAEEGDAIAYSLTGTVFKLNNGRVTFAVEKGGKGAYTYTYGEGGRGSTLTFQYDNVTILKNMTFVGGNNDYNRNRAGTGGSVTFNANKYLLIENSTLNLTAGYAVYGTAASSGHGGDGGRNMVTLGEVINFTNSTFVVTPGSGVSGMCYSGTVNCSGHAAVKIGNITNWSSNGGKLNFTCNYFNTTNICNYYNITMNASRNVELFGHFNISADTRAISKNYSLNVTGTRVWIGFLNFSTGSTTNNGTLYVYTPNVNSSANFKYYVNSSTVSWQNTSINQSLIQFMSRIYNTSVETDTPLLYNFSTYNCTTDYTLYNSSVTYNYTVNNTGTNITCYTTLSDNSTFNNTLNDTKYFTDPYPYNLTVKSGNYTYWGEQDYKYDGNYNGSAQISLEVGNINHYIQNYCNESTCLVPIYIETLTPASINITAVNITYGVDDTNESTFNFTIRIYSDTEGLLNLTDPEFIYESDEQTTLRIRTYYQEPSGSKIYHDDRYISILYSEFNLSLPPRVSYYDVYPLYTGQLAVQPWGQTKTVPVWTIVPDNRTHKFEIKARYAPTTSEPCVKTYWMSNTATLNRATGVNMTETYKALFNVTNNTNKVWAYHDFTANCTWDDLRMYFPNFTFKALCENCVCTENLKTEGFCT